MKATWIIAATLWSGVAAAQDTWYAVSGESGPRPAPPATVTRAIGQGQQSLRIEAAASQAVRRAPEVAAQRADHAAAEAEADVARTYVWPRLELEAGYERLSRIDNDPLLSNPLDAADVNQVEDPAARELFETLGDSLDDNTAIRVPQDRVVLSAVLTYPLSRVLLEVTQGLAATGHRRRAAELRREAAEHATAHQAAMRYLDLALAKAALHVTESANDLAEADADRAKASARAGTSHRGDVARLETRRATSVRMVALARQRYESARVALATLLGLPPETTFALDIRNLPSGSLAEAAPRPDIQALDAEMQAATNRSTQAGRAALPELNLRGALVHARPNPNFVPPPFDYRFSWSVGVGLRWSPNDTTMALRKRRAGEAKLARLAAQRQQLLDEVVRATAAARTQVKGQLAALNAAQSEVEAAELAYRGARARFARGIGHAVAVVDAGVMLQRARLARVQAQIGVARGTLHLAYASGVRWWESQGPPR